MRNSGIFMDNEHKSLEYKKKKAKFEEINGEYLDSNITEEEFNYLIDKSKINLEKDLNLTAFKILKKLEYLNLSILINLNQ